MTFDGLPKQFLSSVRVLFDVLDTKQQGYIEFIDIEAKWNRENTDKLPSGWLIDMIMTAIIIINQMINE